MPLSFQQHTANGSTTVFSASQIDGYLSTGHIYVFVNDVQKTAGVHYNLQTSPSLQVTFIAGNTPAFKDEVRIQRITPNTTADREVDFADGSVLNANDLDKSALQLLYITQEAEDTGSGALGKSFDQLSWNAEDLPIAASAMGTTPTSLATKGYVDNLALYGGAVTIPQAWAFSGNGVQDTFTLSPVATSTDPAMFIVEVGGTILRPTTDYTIPTTSQLVFAGGAIPALGTNNVRVRNLGVARNVNESVSTTMLQNNAVTTLKILDANVTAAKLATDSVETAKIVNLAVTTGKINDLAVTTGKINDLAVTTGKLDNLAVTAGKIAAGAVTSNKLDTNISIAGSLGVGTSATIGGTLGVTGAFTASGGLGETLLTHEIATVSGTAIDCTSIPSWARRIMVAFANLSTNGTSALCLRVGQGSIATSGYSSRANQPGVAWENRTDCFIMSDDPSLVAANAYSGHIMLTRMSTAGNIWLGQGSWVSNTADSWATYSGFFSLGSTMIDRVRLTTLGGANTFDLGNVVFQWE